MSDKRRKKVPKDTQQEIIKILTLKPHQAKDLRIALAKKDIEYSRDRLNDLLNQMIDGGDIQRTVLNNEPYPVYIVTNKSKIRAEIDGVNFQTFFKSLMLQNNELLLTEFETPKNNASQIEALLKFFGFYVMGCLLVSRSKKYIEQRPYFLKSALSLERGISISRLFDSLFPNDKTIENLIRLVLPNLYEKNFKVLAYASKEYKDSFKTIRDFDWSKDFTDFINNWNKK